MPRAERAASGGLYRTAWAGVLAWSVALCAAAESAAPIAIAKQPAGGVFYSGESHDLSVEAKGGTGALQYKWLMNESAIPDGQAASYRFSLLSPEDSGQYVCVVSDESDNFVKTDPVDILVADRLGLATQPFGQTRYIDETCTLTVSAAGGKLPVAFQWQRDGEAMAGETAATLSLGPVEQPGSAAYRCAVTDAGGDTLQTRDAAVCFVERLAVADEMPDTHCAAGTKHAFSATVRGGKGALHFQWQKDGVNLLDATAASYILSRLTVEDAGIYTCLVWDSAEGAVEDDAVLTVLGIVDQPVGAVCPPGQGHEMAVSGVSGLQEPIAYQWLKDGLALKGATESKLSINPAQVSDMGAYQCVLSQNGVSVASDRALLQVTSSPILFDAHPVGGTVYAGCCYSLVVAVSGGVPPLQYQWLRDGEPLPGATAPRFDIECARPEDAGVYTCAVQDAGKAVSSKGAALCVTRHLTIAEQPAGGAYYIGQAHTFRAAAADGIAPVHYQWQHDGVALPGATGPVLYIEPLALPHAGVYTCGIKDAGGDFLVSEPARLDVAEHLSIAVAPGDAERYVGDGLVLKVEARGGVGELHYQWRKYNAALPEATSDTCAFDRLGRGDAGRYDCVVSDDGGDYMISAPAVLSMADRIEIATQPSGGEYYTGESHTFQIEASGGRGGLHCQWQKDGVDVAGATDPVLTLSPLTPAQTGAYVCAVRDDGGDSSTSKAAQLTVADHLTVATQPTGRHAYPGDAVTFAVTAAGGKGELKYQWRKDGKEIEDEHGSEYALDSVEDDDAGQYDCVIEDAGTDSVTSAPAEFTVSDHVAITLDPAGGDYYAGDAHTFSAAAEKGFGELHYQWMRNGAPIAGATADSLEIVSLAVSDAGTYTCAAADDGSDRAVTKPAELSVVEHVYVTAQPQGGDYYVCEAHTLTVEAAGGRGEFSYQWQGEGVDISGATSPALTLDPLGLSDAGAYTCTVTDAQGDTATSEDAHLNVSNPVAIRTHPVGGIRYEGEPCVLSVEAAGGKGLPSYQWRRDGVPLTGATESECRIESLSSGDAGVYTCSVTDTGGRSVLSREAAVEVVAPVSIGKQPQGREFRLGEAHTFTVAAQGGKAALYYQWQFDGQDIPGAASDTLAIDPLAAAHAGSYTCAVHDSGISRAVSEPAVLSLAAEMPPAEPAPPAAPQPPVTASPSLVPEVDK
ncbi:MAG: hypothetical protein QG656_1961 [Candidatus Hydrogenedentes bacterium]|nr:hypothetical protein [Candidatus Hydrogenedentota bacterium]